MKDNQGGIAMRSALVTLAAVVSLALLAAPKIAAAAEPLDYDYYKNRVEPVFLSKRPDHARCFVCHIDSNNAFRLQKMSDTKNHVWSDEESRKNYAVVSALVTPGSPDKSHLLTY